MHNSVSSKNFQAQALFIGCEQHCLACRGVAACGTYCWGGLVRIDVLDAPLSASLVFYGPKALAVRALPLVADASSAAGCMPPSTVEDGAQASLGAEAVQERGGLRIAKEVHAAAGGVHDQ
jgi:hypothetical protein